MGHKFADMDTVGAASGVVCVARKRGVRASIVIEPEKAAAKTLIERLRREPEYRDVFINPQEAILRADSRTLLVLVDTNRPEQAEDRALLEACNHVQALFALLSSSGPACLDLPGLRVTRDRDQLRFGPAARPDFPDLPVTPGGKFDLPGGQGAVSAEKIENCVEIYPSFKTFYFKYASICDSIFCTRRREGDRIRLTGRGCTKSLKDLFNEAKMTQAEKDRTPVFRDGKGVVAVAGFGVAQRCAPSPGDTVLRIQIE